MVSTFSTLLSNVFYKYISYLSSKCFFVFSKWFLAFSKWFLVFSKWFLPVQEIVSGFYRNGKSRSKRTSQPIKDYNLQKYSPTKNTGSTWVFLIVQIKPIKTVQILDLSTNDGLWSILGTPIVYPTAKFHYVRCFTCRH